MRTRLTRLAVAAVLAAGLAALPGATAGAAEVPDVTFTLLDDLPETLDVGEKVEICVRVESSEPFVMAIALSDAYFPGRSVRFDGSPATAGGTTAVLCLTLIGRSSTADLPGAQDWPGEEDWPAGVAPLAVRVGVRFAGGAVVSTGWLFDVVVP